MEKNGFDVDQFQAMLTMLQQQPEAAKVSFRSRFAWEGGFAGEAHVEAIEQMGQTMPRNFVFRCDVPHEWLGGDTGTAPAERLLSALGHCIGTAYAAQATKQGIDVRGIEVELEGRLDLCGFLQLDSVRPGLSGIEAKVRVESDADDAALRRLGEATRKTSPIYDSLANPVPIDVRVERSHLVG